MEDAALAAQAEQAEQRELKHAKLAAIEKLLWGWYDPAASEATPQPTGAHTASGKAYLQQVSAQHSFCQGGTFIFPQTLCSSHGSLPVKLIMCLHRVLAFAVQLGS